MVNLSHLKTMPINVGNFHQKINIMLTKKMIQLTTIRILLLLISLLSMASHASNLTASVDRDEIGLRETLTLTVSLDDSTKNTPDFSGLKNDFDILSNQRASSTQVYNGNRVSSTDWQLTLAPKHAGKLLIPSFNVDNSVSDAIEIKVSQQNQTQQSGDDEQVRTSIEVSKNSIYVQEQVLVTIKLISEINLSQAEMEPLELKDALVVNLDKQQYITKINGVDHLIIETNLAIFPQESGELIIPSLAYTVATGTMNPFARSRNNILRLRTDEQHITVKPAPTQNTNNSWQPAQQLSLHETWSSSLDHLKIGEPVTRTITINTDGLTAGQIAPLQNTAIDGLTFYPDQAQTKDNNNAKGVKGTRIETIAIVPNRGGDFTLPAINVDWWNTSTQKMETASLPAKTIHVLGDASITTTPKNLASSTTNESTQEPSTEITNNNSQDGLPLWILIITGLFALLSVGLAVYIWKLKKHIDQLHQDQHNREIALQEKEKDIWDVLKTAANNKDAPALRKAVLNWAQFQWPAEKINTLDEIAKLGKNDELTAALKELDEILYSNHDNADWDANALLKLLNEYRKQKKTKKKSPTLKTLYSEHS